MLGRTVKLKGSTCSSESHSVVQCHSSIQSTTDSAQADIREYGREWYRDVGNNRFQSDQQFCS